MLSFFRLLKLNSLATYRLQLSRSFADKLGPIQTAIQEKLTHIFKPKQLEIVNESRLHTTDHGAESHFRIAIVSTDFDKINDLARHRLITKALHKEFEVGLHALSILAKSPSENMPSRKSIPCIGKSKKLEL